VSQSAKRRRRVKGISFDPELLAEIEADVAARGVGLSEWVRDAARGKLARGERRPAREETTTGPEVERARGAEPPRPAAPHVGPKVFRGPLPKTGRR
jgi:hypothetical protein